MKKMNEMVEKLGRSLQQVGVAIKYSTNNKVICKHWTDRAIDEAIKYLNEAKVINELQERFEDVAENVELAQ
jgi:transcriptional regulatory protein LevR